MPTSHKRSPLSVLDDALADEDAGLLDDAPPSNDTAAPLPPDSAPASDEAEATPVTRALTNAFLAKKTTQARIREVVEYRAPRRMQRADVLDLIQKANLRAMETTSLARSVPGMRPWISRIAQNVVIDHFRADATQLKWLDRAVEVQELPPDPAAEGDEAELSPEDPTAPPRPVETVDERRLVTWLGQNVKTAADRLTLEMLVEKGTTGKSNAVIAAEHAMTEAAFDNRILRFKARWIPQWKRSEERRQRAVLLLVLAGVLVAAALAWWLLHRGAKIEEIRPTEVPVLLPAPTASVAPPPVFNQADPTHDVQEGPKGRGAGPR